MGKGGLLFDFLLLEKLAATNQGILFLLKFCPSISKCKTNTDLKVIFDNCSF